MIDISIQRVLAEDAEILTRIALAAKSHWGYPERWMEIWKPELTFDSNYFETNESWDAIVDDQVVAFYTLQERDDHAWLENLWVLPSQMGNGVGRALFEHVLQLSRQRGYHTLRLESDPNAIGFYQHMGMHQIGERQSQIDGQPRVLPIMEIEL